MKKKRLGIRQSALMVLLLGLGLLISPNGGQAEMNKFNGGFCEGEGDIQWLQMLEDCWLVLDGSGTLCSLMEDCYSPK